MRLHIGYPPPEEERRVLDRASSLHPAEDRAPVMTAQDVLDLQAQVDKVFVEESLTEYLLQRCVTQEMVNGVGS